MSWGRMQKQVPATTHFEQDTGYKIMESCQNGLNRKRP